MNELQKENEELRCYIERLRVLLTMTIKHWDNDDNPMELPSFVSELNAVLNEPPTQSLAHIQAQVEEETIERCVELMAAIGAKEYWGSFMPRKYAKDGE